MRSSSSSSVVVAVVVSLLVLSLLFTGAQGIRFKKGLLSLEQHDETIHKEKKSSLIKTIDGTSVAETVLCKEAAGNCNTGIMNRKLISTTSTTSTTNSKNIGENKAKAKANDNPTSKSKSSSDGKTFGEQTEESHNSSQDLYVDITDMAEMDYSPARRKPPIHN